MEPTEMNLERVISTLNIPASKILNVYVTGSRVYGTNDANSDWDFFVIVEDDADLASGWELIEVGDVNAGVAKISHFVDIILNRDQNLQAICCLFVPQEFIWLENAKNLHERYKVHKYSLKQSILSKACSCFHRAEWYCNEAEKTENEAEKAKLSRKSKKMIFHCLRYLHLGLQLFDTGKIYDFKVANHYWSEIQQIDSVKWIDYEKVYRPIYLELLHKLPRQIDQMVEGFSSDPLLTELWRLTHLPIIQQGYQLSIVNHCQEIARHVAPYEDWCEKNYDVWYYLAEFWNSTSSLALSLFGVIGFYLARREKFEFRYQLFNLFVAIVGLGSAAFHGTLLYSMQMWDELPMVYTTMVTLYILSCKEKPAGKGDLKAGIFYIVYAIACSALHFMHAFVTIFQVHFGLLVFSAQIWALVYASRFKTMNDHKNWFWPYLFFQFAALGAWLIDLHFCHWIEENLPFNPQLHAVWHTFSAIASYCTGMSLCALRSHYLKEDPQINYFWKIFPYIKRGKAKNKTK